MDYSQIGEAIIITMGVVVAQIAISYRTQNIIIYRINELEKKQEKHNNLVERVAVAERDIKTINRRLDELSHEK